MLSYEENVRAILECCFSQSKDELIDCAVKSIMAIKPGPVVINPAGPEVVPLPYPNPIVAPVITWTATTEDLKKFQNSNIIKRENERGK